jgi:hypothetical protein
LRASKKVVGLQVKGEGRGFITQKKPVKFLQFQAPGFSIYGVRTLLMIPTTLLFPPSKSALNPHLSRFSLEKEEYLLKISPEHNSLNL